jgi:hypothetical protein
LFLDPLKNKDPTLQNWKKYIRIEFIKQTLDYEKINGVATTKRVNIAKIYGVK